MSIGAPSETKGECPPLRIAVVGGGIAGLTAAIAVLHYAKNTPGSNVRLDVYESATAFAEIGAGVALGPNAQQSLRLIGLGEALEKVAGKSGQSDDDLWFDFCIGAKDHPHSGEEICSLRGKNAGRGNVHRADFLDGLIALLPTDQAHFSKRCINYETHSSGITLKFADGSTAETDVLVASDGIKSLVRERLYLGLDKSSNLELQKAMYSEWIAWRGMIEREVFEEICGKGSSDKKMLLGQGRHILHFPVRGGSVINIVAFVKDPEHKKLGGHTGPWSESRPKEEMLQDFVSFNETSLALLEAIEDPSIWGIFELPEIPRAVDGRVVLIGDAAHATTPHQGSGAGQAIEDGVFIAAILAQPSVSSTPISDRPKAIASALKIYETTRHQRGRKVQKTSREAGMLYEFLDAEAKDDVEKIKGDLEERMNWIWDYGLEVEIEGMLKKLEEDGDL